MSAKSVSVLVLGAVMALGSMRCGTDTAGVDAALTDIGVGAFGTGLTYQYTGYDSTGREIVRGKLVVAAGDSDHFTGTWSLEAVGDPGPMIGPQVGTGTIAGKIVQSSFGANLNPDMVDNNVVLLGTIRGEEISGIWEFIGFPGVLNEGSFIAVRAR